MNADVNMPATKGDVREAFNEAVGLFRGELKEGLSGLRTELKTEISASVDRLAKRILGSEARMDRLEDRLLAEMHDMKAAVLKAFEDSTFKGKMYYEKALTHTQTLEDHGFHLVDHEKRLKALEDKNPG
ncbi:MAG: hypothetical protein WC943_03765 [Elusimicrobiota bacterium]